MPIILSRTHDVLAVALALEKEGYWIVPCHGKRPTIKDWQLKRLSADELTQALQGRNLNIAIALHRSDFCDIEADSDEAEVAIQKMFDGDIPRTPTYRSKRGLHRFFRRPAGLPEKAKLEIDGVEYRIGNGMGALSIVPPSVHPDGPRYEWLRGLSLFDVKPADLPTKVVAKLCGRTKTIPLTSSPESGILEGRRNDTLFQLACRLRDADLTEKDVEIALITRNSAHCKPPLPDEEVIAIVRSAMAGKADASQDFWCTLAAAELWHTPKRDAYATIMEDGHREHWPIRSKAFRQWVSRCHFQKTGKIPSSQKLQDVLGVLEGRALYDGPTYPLYLRVAEHEKRIYVDLVDDAWRAIEIDSSEWRIVEEPPVRFRRVKAMLPLPVPLRGGSLTQLRRFVNVSDLDWPLVAAWLVAAFRPGRPFTILKLLAEQGSGKTSTARALRAVVDPNVALARSAPRDERDLMIAASNGWVINLDNLSYISTDLSDALCRLVTGGGFSTRTLYENDEETIFNAQRPVILNGIEDIGSRSDLLDRSLIVELPRIEADKRQSEKVFWKEFERDQPYIVGAILDAVSAAIRRLPAIEQLKREWPRMADFAQWAVAAEISMGLRPGEFDRSYAANRESANQTALDATPVASALFGLFKKQKEFVGTATALLAKLSYVDANLTGQKGWPKNAQALSGILARIAPNLRQSGISIDQTTTGTRNEKRRAWRIVAAGAK